MISKIPQSKLIKDIASMLIIFLGSAFVILNLFYYGRNDDLANFINTVFNPPLAFITTMLALILLHQVLPSFRSRALWLGLVLGWGCWAVAESLWAIAFLKGDEVLFPSWADLFWTVGYIPIIIALFIRSRSMAGEPSRMNRFVITVLSVLILGFTFFGILLPIIRAYDASAALEGALSLFYPLADTILVFLALRILLTSEQGKFVHSWFWIAAGFIVSSFSDLFFSFATVLDLYYPNGQANLLSVFIVDVPYTLSYLFFIAGLVALWQVKQLPGLADRPQGRVPTGRMPS